MDILEGDGSVVNVIEGHPTLPLIAVSGIDTTVKASEMVSSDSRSCISDECLSCLHPRVVLQNSPGWGNLTPL